MSSELIATASLVLALCGLQALAACKDDENGSNGTGAELCCACVRDEGCGGDDFEFGTCVPDGYQGNVSVTYDQGCIENSCASPCENAAFRN